MEESGWVDITDCRNSKILFGCFNRAWGVMEEKEERKYMKISKWHVVREK